MVNEELEKATQLAETMKGKSAGEIAAELNAKLDGLYYASGYVVYLQNEPDYLPPHMVIRLT